MKNFSDTTGNRNRNLPACTAVPQPTATPRVPFVEVDVPYCIVNISLTGLIKQKLYNLNAARGLFMRCAVCGHFDETYFYAQLRPGRP